MGDKETSLSRRGLLAGAGAVAAGSVVASCSQSSESDDEHWDETCDVLCVGSGAAGATAAITATAQGAEVLILEKMPYPGGTTAKSGGVAWIFNNFLLKEKGIDDRKEDALKYAVRYGYSREYDPDSPTLGLDETRFGVIESFYDHGSEAVDFLRETGAVQFKEFRLYQLDKPAPDYADHLPENKVPSGRCLEPAEGSGATGGGGSLFGQLSDYLEAQGVPVMLDTQVTRIVKDTDGRVTGVEALRDGEPLRIRAKRGVVFATGGYSHNVELCNLHQPSVYGSCAMPGSTGDFIPLAQEAGAKMGNLGYAWRSQVVMDEAVNSRAVGLGAFVLPGDSMILVNKYGKRVVNEKRDYNDRTQAHFPYDPAHEEYPNHLLFMVFDARSLDAFGGAFPLPTPYIGQSHVLKGANVDELARKIDAQLAQWSGKTGGVKLAEDFTANLGDTISRYNAFAEAGVDADFGRGKYRYDREWHKLFSARREGTEQPENPYPNITMHPFASEGPYFAIVLAPGTLDTAGGPQINADAQILGPDNEPIPGLYGAGNCIASPTGQAYLGAGGTIGPALAFGYVAGKHAAES
ncbi:FAD-dependent oxidoreductase [Erythrobacter sp. SCSIO 43205]|uniref:FAD-dependent oxidoreductase n=1 Tax=Erythrobacter sp. SCSIO 43205 TaxID=2779361 RepID=UPI001CA90B7D|nr:FAD-dependent oxidoreductase [Erythrobacter sp. SCSIO 43205]UAB79330.1 FAD-dependent oxidoreductase [Erythrobacter sp. SCSIO 43205]